MLKALRILLLSACAASVFAGAATAVDQPPGDPPPYKLVRSLQAIQDAIVQGDHSSSDMQRFILGTIDARLRNAPASTFDDPRNVDAAFIYAMSGGNPETLSYLANRDIEGNFDTRIVDALGHYLGGKGGLMIEGLEKTIPEYRNARIGPYLYLVLGNGIATQNPKAAISYYDQARLRSPGTNIEEAALRRSIALATRNGLIDRGFAGSLTYARRFVNSPYASQFADMFVELAVANYGEATKPKIEEILGFFDGPRRREVYLRIARRAAIGGMQELASLASAQAQSLSDSTSSGSQALATFYSGLVNVPSKDILGAVREIDAIPDDQLSPRDRQLRDAAAFVAEEVLRRPQAASLTQASSPTVDAEETGNGAGASDSPFAAPQTVAQPAESAELASSDAAPADPALDAFLSKNRSRLDEIDSLLKGGDE